MPRGGLGLGLGEAGTGAGLYQGLEDWMRRRMAQQEAQNAQEVFGLEKEDRLRKQRLEDEAMTEERATRASSKAALIQALAEIDASDLTPMQKMVAKLNLQAGKGVGIDLPAPKEKTFQIAPSGEAYDPTDPTIVGRKDFGPPPKEPKAVATRVIETPQGQFLINDETGEIIKQYGGKPREPREPREESLIALETIDAKGNPVTRYITKAEARGREFPKPSSGSGAVLPATLREAQVNAQVAQRGLADLKQIFEGDATTPGAKQYIGPGAGRVASILESVPGAPVNKTFSQFKAATARLKNSIIKATTGAGMSNAEAERIIAEIPIETDKPQVWQVKYDQSLRNFENLLAVIQQQAGGAAPVRTPGGGAENNDPLGIR